MKPKISYLAVKRNSSKEQIENKPACKKVTFLPGEDRKVDFKSLKYDFNELFNNTPIFDQPYMQYNEKPRELTWERIAKSLMKSDGLIHRYVKQINKKASSSVEITERRKSKVKMSSRRASHAKHHFKVWFYY